MEYKAFVKVMERFKKKNRFGTIFWFSKTVWSHVFFFSIAKDCGFLQVPVNGSLVGLFLTTFPNSLTFACDPGFILKGSRVRHCEANASWGGNETLCQGTVTGMTSMTKTTILV